MSAIFDPHTNLPNHALFMDRLNVAIAYSKRNNQTLAIFMLCVNDLKPKGHIFEEDIKNELFLAIAKRLSSCLKEVDTLSRYDDNHFAIILHDISIKEVGQLAERLIESLSKLFRIDNNKILISSNIGISLYPYHSIQKTHLLENAKIAMYQAKDNSKNTFVLFNKDINQKNLRHLIIKAGLSQAIKKNQFKVLYQPQLCLKTGEFYGVEALLRWEHPDLGLVSPGEFIPYLESTGQICMVGEWLINHVCQQIKNWNDQGMKPFIVSVNISSYQLYDDQFVDKIVETFKAHQVPFEQVTLEITESIELHQSTNLIKKLNLLKTLGVNLAVDDFGTGYSSYKILKQLPLSILKLDQSFLENLGKTDQEIIEAIIKMANALNLKVIAEGVEDISHIFILKNLNCDIVQGFGISQPLTSDSLQRNYEEIQQIGRSTFI